MSSDVHFAFENTYARLPERFYARLNPIPVAAPELIQLNAELARHLRLNPEALASEEGVEILAGNRVPHGSEPLAQAYAGHQFGNFVRQLGDGRTNLLGEVVGTDGVRYDIQLKGSGPTPFSRRGDGRAALGPVLREYIVSEAMAVLGVPTTRALAAVFTGSQVIRETILPGGVLTRVASSHLRVGTFQFFAAQADVDALKQLANYAITRHYPEAAMAEKPYRAFLDGVIARQARLVAQWMLLGFIHGVMNTDNTSISGETIDYGPCAFMEAYQQNKVYSSIDQQGRYNFSNQPHAMHWNLARLAEAILPLLVEEEGSDEAGLASAYAALEKFGTQYEEARNAGLLRKIGILAPRDGDVQMAEELLKIMESRRADFTLTFRMLCDAVVGEGADTALRGLFSQPEEIDAWVARWRGRLAEEAASVEERVSVMRRSNPRFIPRNHFVQAVIDAAVERHDFQPFEELLEATSRPFDDRPELDRYARPALPKELVLQTFCGT